MQPVEQLLLFSHASMGDAGSLAQLEFSCMMQRSGWSFDVNNLTHNRHENAKSALGCCMSSIFFSAASVKFRSCIDSWPSTSNSDGSIDISASRSLIGRAVWC